MSHTCNFRIISVDSNSVVLLAKENSFLHCVRLISKLLLQVGKSVWIYWICGEYLKRFSDFYYDSAIFIKRKLIHAIRSIAI